MSGNSERPSAHFDDSFHETADRIVRDILDDRIPTPASISPSGELYRAIERFHEARRRRAEQELAVTQERRRRRAAESEFSSVQLQRLRRMASDPRGVLDSVDEANRSLPSSREQPPSDGVSLHRSDSSDQAREPMRTIMERSQPSQQRESRSIADSEISLHENRRRWLRDVSSAAYTSHNSVPSMRSDRAVARSAAARRARRPPLMPSDRSLERARTLHDAAASSSSLLADMHQAGQRLEAASSSLRALLDDPVPDIPSPVISSLAYTGDSENRRAKRRKLDTDNLDPEFTGFSYGKYGQVEPGKLKMEIVSCDGGIYQENEGIYSAENVLSSDDSVYCTKNNRCNLILRHQGGTVFSLKELVIKAPHKGYTAPIQQGMVFVSMTSDELLTRTAEYQIQYSLPQNNRTPSPQRIVSIRHDDEGMASAQARVRRLYDIGVRDDDSEYRTAQIPLEFTTDAPSFEVTTEFSDCEGDAESYLEGEMRRRRQRARDDLVEHDDLSSGDEDPDLRGIWSEDYLLGPHPSTRRRRAAERSRDTAWESVFVEPDAASEAMRLETQTAERAVGGKLMAPHARFFFEKDKSKCTIRFHPPVSGRFILLKMWNPRHNSTGNIDIESVSAMGYAGPRFFPALTLA